MSPLQFNHCLEFFAQSNSRALAGIQLVEQSNHPAVAERWRWQSCIHYIGLRIASIARGLDAFQSARKKMPS